MSHPKFFGFKALRVGSRRFDDQPLDATMETLEIEFYLQHYHSYYEWFTVTYLL